MHLENEIWQKIPGSVSTWIYPLIRKPSITGSNTYIIRSGRYLIVIDPGAIPDQMVKTKDILKKEISNPDHLIILVAGHIHIDHMYLGMTDRELRNLGQVIIAAEYQGAIWLEEGDCYRTGADVVGLPIPRTPVALHLLTPEDKQNGVTRHVSVDGKDDLILTSHILACNGEEFYSQSMPLADGDRIEFWSSPGHSEDSITIRIGALFHIGDIPFAINPGIAGRPGYDRNVLLRSIISIKSLFEHEKGLICCTGHGRALNREATLTMLNRLEQDTRALPEISVFDEKRLNLSMWHGLDLAEEAHRIYPVIAGRIMFLCFQLEKLGMEEEAGEINSLFEYESVDQLLDEFNTFYLEYKEGKKIKPEVLIKALQIFGKIESSFPADSLTSIIDISLIRRATRIFSDLLGTIRGVIPVGSPEEILLISLIRECIADPALSDINDFDLIQVADDESQFRRVMVSRIAHYSHRRRFSFHLDEPDDTLSRSRIRVDRVRFADFFSGLSEYFESISVQAVDISIIIDSDIARIIFTPRGDAIRYERQAPGAMLREAGYAGGKVISVMEPGKEDIRVSFPLAG